jgi:hypothetical protein
MHVNDIIDHAKVEYAGMRQAGSTELIHAMNFGADLIQLKEVAPKRAWQQYVRGTFGVSKSTAAVCIKLAKARSFIETSSAAGRIQSIRDALKLLQKPATGTSKTKTAKKNSQSAPAPLTNKITAAFKLALDLARPDIGNHAEIANAMRAVNRLLAANGFDLHDIDISVGASAKGKRYAA